MSSERRMSHFNQSSGCNQSTENSISQPSGSGLPRTTNRKSKKLGSGESSTEKKVISVDDVDLDFITPVYRIIRTHLEEPITPEQRVEQTMRLAQQIEDLGKKFNVARSQIKELPGIESSKEEQAKQLETLKQVLTMKKKLIADHRGLLTDIASFGKNKS